MERYRKGDLTEAIVIAELERRDIPVSIPFGDRERYDLLIEAPGDELLRIQVKTGRLIDGTIRFNGTSRHTYSQGTTHRGYEGNVDYFIVYCDALEAMYLVAEEHVNTEMHLRIEAPDLEHPSINWARDYEFDQNWPPNDSTDSYARNTPISSHRRGNATEAHVIAELLRREIPVTVPPTDNERYDLLAGTPDERFFRIQVKTGRIYDGRLHCKGYSNHITAAGTVYKPYDCDIDYFLIYSPDLDEMYLVEEDEFESSIRLRVEEPKQVHRDTKWAEDYEFDRNWPPGDHPSPTPTRRHPRDRVLRNTVIEELRDLDVSIAHPIEDDAPYDLLAETPNGGFARMTIRTAQLKDGRVFFHSADPTDDAIDHYLVYCHDLDETYLIARDAFDTSVSLWVDEPKTVHRTTKWAEDFELERSWPPSDGRVIPRKSPVGLALAALQDRGAEVTYPAGDDVPYDLLAVTEGRFRRIAVEPGWVWNGRIRLKPGSSDGIDAFLLYCRELDTCYLVGADEFEASISLRVEPSEKADRTINRAEEYELDARWPSSTG